MDEFGGASKEKTKSTTNTENPRETPVYSEAIMEKSAEPTIVTQLNLDTLKSKHRTYYDTVDWTEVLVNKQPPAPSFPTKL